MINNQRSITIALAAVTLLSAPVSGQSHLQADLGTAIDTPFAAVHASYAFQPRSWLSLVPDVSGATGGLAWYGLAGGRVQVVAGPVAAWIRLAAGRFDQGAAPAGVMLTGAGATWSRGRVAVTAAINEGRTRDTRRWAIIQPPPIPIDTGGQIEAPAETTMVGVSGRLWRDVSARIDWSHGRLAASAASGFHFEVGSRGPLWGAIEGAWSVTPRLSMVAALTSRGRTLWEGGPAQGPLRLGLRATLGREATRTRREAGFEARTVDRVARVTELRVYLPKAERVEMTADFIDWRVVVLEATDGGMWETRLVVPPGSHRVNIRINGGPWIVPPGLPAVQDEFNGKVGVLRIP